LDASKLGGESVLLWQPGRLEVQQSESAEMEKFIALTVVAAIVIFAATYVLSVARSHKKGK